MWNMKGCCEARVDVNNQGRRVGEGERERRGGGRGGGIHTKAKAIDRHQLLVNHDDPHRGSDIEKPCSNIQSCFPVCFACRVPIRLPNNRGCHLLLPPPNQCSNSPSSSSYQASCHYYHGPQPQPPPLLTP